MNAPRDPQKKRLATLLFLAFSCLTANAMDVSPYEPNFENPRDHTSGRRSQDAIIRVNDIVCVKQDDRAPIAVLSFQSPETADSAAGGDGPQSSSDRCCSGFMSSLTSFQPPARPLRADKYWVGIVRRAANISATERRLEIHHFDGWLRAPEGMMIVPAHPTEDATAPGGTLRANIPDCPGWWSNECLYDQKALNGGYFFEEGLKNVDDHYVRVVTINERQGSEKIVADGDFTAELRDTAEVTKVVLDGFAMHSYAMDHIDVLNARIRAYWSAVADHTRNRALGNSITAIESAGMQDFQGGFKMDILRNITNYIDHMGHVVNWNDGVANWLKEREPCSGLGLPQELEAYYSYLERRDVNYTSFDRAAYARVHQPQSVHVFDAAPKAAETSDKLAGQSALSLRLKATLEKKAAHDKAMIASGEKKPRMTMEEMKAQRAETMRNQALDKDVVAKAATVQATFKEGKEEFEFQRKANWILVTGSEKDWAVTVDNLPADDDEFWSGVEGTKNTIAAAGKLKLALRQSQEINLMKLNKAYATLPPSTPEHYIAAVKASHKAILRVSNPEGAPLVKERSLVRELIEQTPSCGEKLQTPLLLFNANDREISISGWKNILTYVTQPLAAGFSGRDGGRASISIARR